MKLNKVFNWIPCLTTFGLVSSLFANPSDPSVISGNVSFMTNGDTLDVDSSSTRAIVEWGSFSNSSNQTVNFNLPSSSSAILNRVTTADTPSSILGTIESNGIVYLVNQSGILLGPECVVNAASFLASTLDCDNQEFLDAEDMTFTGMENSEIFIDHYATITASDGDVILLGYQVNNQGTTNADNGTAAIGAGIEVVLQPTSDQRLLITPQSYLNVQERGVNGGGTINALHTEFIGDGNAYEFAIFHDGIVNATGTVSDDCSVVFHAVEGTLFANGVITAGNNDDVGGLVEILGTHLQGGDGGFIFASGESGGGEIYMGGGLNGTTPELTLATTVQISNSFQFECDALVSGDGGTVVVWSDGDNGYTEFAGSATARGGSVSGNGGYVQVNGVQTLDNTGTADVSAPNGTEGTAQYDF